MSRRTVELEAEAEDDRDKKTVGRGEGGPRARLGREIKIIKGGKEKEKEKREGITIITHVK